MDQPSSSSAAGHHKTFVFVDEYNRHKRLKVMRACDGCRKRKIRCDGALSNGPWPCGACQRLKLKCIPPTLDGDDDQTTPDSATGPGQFSFQTTAASSSSNPSAASSNQAHTHEWAGSRAGPVPSATAPVHHDFDYSSQLYSQQLGPRLDPGYSDDEYFASTTAPTQFQSNRQAPPSLIRSQTEASTESSGDLQEVNAYVRELSERMGDLAIDLSSTAPYIANEKKNLAEAPAVEEVDIVLPPSVSTDLTVRIPPEMMPSEERAMDYFGYYFDYIHPYVPVLHRSAFYDQWRNARHSISPLILEGIFACVSRYLEDHIEVRRWLALASRHEESFKDVPRLSTIQALMILTKAREFIPKRGYYYRSWMAVKYMTTMGFDLGLQEHYDQHRSGRPCNLTASDCMVRTRMWQSLFGLEVWIGAPQGRTDFAVEQETVDFSLPSPSSEIDALEHQVSRRTVFLAQAVRNIKQTNVIWQNMRRYKKDWALDPIFVRQNDIIDAWAKNLPADMQVQFSDDDSPPWLGGDHFVAYLHVYHRLIIIIQHRPQLQTFLEQRDQAFKHHLAICNEAAIQMCCLQEALYRDFGLHGLQFMQRGIGFTIYCVLTCILMHLATVTSPDPATNSRARKFFTRHMRILEHCAPSASPEVQVQISSLREAFSQDTSKAFELRQNLGLRSPPLSSQPTPPGTQPLPHSSSGQAAPTWAHLQDAASSKTLSPASEYTPPYDHTPSQPTMPFNTSSYSMPSQAAYAPPGIQQVTSAPAQGYALEPVISNEQQTPVWDPSGIFQQWNAAFGAQAPAQAAQPVVPDPRMQPTSAPIIQPPQQSPPNPQPMYSSQQMPSSAGSAVPEPLPSMPTVTPVMWQDAFTNAYVSGHGHKRYREENLDPTPYDHYAKRRG